MESVEVVPDEFEIWPENDISLGVFLRSTTQWRYCNEAVGSRIVGLDYPAVETVMRLCNIDNKSEVFDDIRAIELAVLGKIKETNP